MGHLFHWYTCLIGQLSYRSYSELSLRSFPILWLQKSKRSYSHLVGWSSVQFPMAGKT